MIAFEVILNGKRVCIAGAEDLQVLSTNVTAVGRLGSETVSPRPDLSREIHYSVSGLTGHESPAGDLHLRWGELAALEVGDLLEIRVLEVDAADPVFSATPAKKMERGPKDPRG